MILILLQRGFWPNAHLRYVLEVCRRGILNTEFKRPMAFFQCLGPPSLCLLFSPALGILLIFQLWYFFHVCYQGNSYLCFHQWLIKGLFHCFYQLKLIEKSRSLSAFKLNNLIAMQWLATKRAISKRHLGIWQGSPMAVQG